MTRSQAQIAMSYAPGQHFTFEGAAGACQAIPSPNATPARLDPTTRVQIEMRINEAARAWFDKAIACRQNDTNAPPPFADFCVEVSLLDSTRTQYSFRPQVFTYLRPDRMGYLPRPTTLICSECGLIEATDNPRQMGERLSALSQACAHPKRPNDPTRCSWGQLDVIFAHWSGSWKAASPNMTVYDQASRRPIKRYAVCGKCGTRQFVLNKDQVALSNWSFSCANCGTKHPDPWIEKCDETLGRIAATIGSGGNIVGEASMEKINYAASSAYFVKSDTFITFPENSGIEALEPGQAHLLADVIERIVGLEGPPLSDAEVAAQLVSRDRPVEAREFDEILQGLQLATDNQNTAVANLMINMKAERLSIWQRAGWLTRNSALPAHILAKLQERHEWTGKYDPFRLLVEHEALSKTKLRGEIVGGRASYVDFTNPDEWLVTPNSPQRATMISTAEQAKTFLGVERAGLISKFDLCKFSYGFSRVGNGPKIHKHGRMMPVRLNLFPRVHVAQETLHPVYVLEQSNEAFYFKLDEALVRAWLSQAALGCVDIGFLAEYPDNFAAAMLGSAGVMSGYLEEHDRESNPTIYTMTYALLHSYSHYIMQGIQQFSGLDLGSIGEYLFPCDLGFVVYRNGMTLDLGDLSALWRNHHEAFLSYLRNFPTSLGCNLGNLCMTKGGACPDCIMIPEVICLTANKYLSRSTLIGRGRPDFIVGEEQIRGYLQFALDHARSKQ
ncbi:hypothetical protein DPM33_19010 [Mesorhizobium hawassense]|uniref:DUF1998 domain-containing protein n=2 Tax=Mesorhizobium hawassense TaxID=1209954 RepID=A0A330HNM1_9HYPH|nr:hypothetical protein DPM33_19010 [Mesorhizobium hawassense]